MELSELLQKKPEEITELSLIEQMSYWTWKKEQAYLQIRQLIQDAQKNTTEERDNNSEEKLSETKE